MNGRVRANAYRAFIIGVSAVFVFDKLGVAPDPADTYALWVGVGDFAVGLIVDIVIWNKIVRDQPDAE